jgi:hypothetical protein
MVRTRRLYRSRAPRGTSIEAARFDGDQAFGGDVAGSAAAENSPVASMRTLYIFDLFFESFLNTGWS